MPKTTYISEAGDDEQGSFSSTASQHTYENTNIFGASRAESEALDRDEEVYWMDSSIDSSVPYEVAEDQRFNIHRTDTDSQGISTPPAHGPGH